MPSRPAGTSPWQCRQAVPGDAEALVGILGVIAAEERFTAITEPWPAEIQRRYLASLSRREAVHVAIVPDGRIVGYQTLDLWAPSIASMAHVGQVGTFISSAWRGCGIGAGLFTVTVDFARRRDYAKFVIQVRASNAGALAFYRRLGFVECGRLSRQVRIAGDEEDEILLELFL